MESPIKNGHRKLITNSPKPTNFNNHKSYFYLNGVSSQKTNSESGFITNRVNSSEEFKDPHVGIDSKVSPKNINEFQTEPKPENEFCPIVIKRMEKIKPKILPVIKETLVDSFLIMKECKNLEKKPKDILTESSTIDNNNKDEILNNCPVSTKPTIQKKKSEEKRGVNAKAMKIRIYIENRLQKLLEAFSSSKYLTNKFEDCWQILENHNDIIEFNVVELYI